MSYRCLIYAEAMSDVHGVVTGYGPAVSSFRKRKVHCACFSGIFLNNYFTKHLRTTASQKLYNKVSLKKEKERIRNFEQSFNSFVKIGTLKNLETF